VKVTVLLKDDLYIINCQCTSVSVLLVQSLLFTNKCTSDSLKNSIKIYIKIAPTCFGAVTPSSGSALSMLAKVTLC